jgi:acetyl-CoA C-acetyltransferase
MLALIQDKYATESYMRAQKARDDKVFDTEILPISIPGGRNKPAKLVSSDEEIGNYSAEKVATMKPAFRQTNGTVTASNSSPLNDGAACLVLMSGSRMAELGLTPLAKIVSFAGSSK